MRRPFVVGIAGGSGAGKSVAARALELSLGATVISLDTYFRSFPDMSFEACEALNWDDPRMLDVAIALDDVVALKEGRSIPKRTYDFASHSRLDGPGIVEPASLVVVEGLWVLYLNPIQRLLDTSIFLDASQHLRLERRIERDSRLYGLSASGVAQKFRLFVEPGFQRFVLPTKQLAGHILDAECDAVALAERVTQHVSLVSGPL